MMALLSNTFILNILFSVFKWIVASRLEKKEDVLWFREFEEEMRKRGLIASQNRFESEKYKDQADSLWDEDVKNRSKDSQKSID